MRESNRQLANEIVAELKAAADEHGWDFAEEECRDLKTLSRQSRN